MCEHIFQSDDSDQKIYDFCHLYMGVTGGKNVIVRALQPKRK